MADKKKADPEATGAANAAADTAGNGQPPETSASSESTLSFEAGLKQLESIVKEMESSELPLERALELFERGMKLSEACRKQLEQAETRVEILMKRASSAAGEDRMQPQPFRTEKP